MLIEFLEKHNVECSQEHHHSRPGWVQLAECPFCGSQNYHLGIKLDATRAACYKCGGHGVAKVLKEVTSAPWREILSITRQGVFVAPEPEVTCGTYTPPTCLGPFKPMHTKYLQSRGLDPEYCATVWGMQGTGPFSDYPFRVFIPINLRGKPVSWTARAVKKGTEPRYQTAMKHQKSVDEKRLIYGMDFVKRAVIIVEGPLDAVNIGQGAGATFGLSVTNAQILLLAQVPRRIVCFDNSDDAQRRAEVLAEQLAVFPGETFRVNLDADDPGSASRSEVLKLRRFAFGVE